MTLAHLMKRGSLRPAAAPRPANAGPCVATVATVAVAKAKNDAVLMADDPEFSPPDLDRWSWPNGDAMNGAEIDRMADCLSLFARHGLSRDQAERLADMLVRRDRGADDRRVCLECANLRGRSCGQPEAAGMGRNVEQFALILQRCPSFRIGAVTLLQGEYLP